MSRDDERSRRIGMNESLFRNVNEQLESLTVRFRDNATTLELVCECGDPECDAPLRVDRDEYERTRRNPVLFLVIPGHEIADVEEIVASGDGFDIVRKREGAPAAVARATDPRDAG